ncbi:MAG: hypothetical protein RLY30_479 [Pseudomonadota bacterium]|jgi:hypothetical protein
MNAEVEYTLPDWNQLGPLKARVQLRVKSLKVNR